MTRPVHLVEIPDGSRRLAWVEQAGRAIGFRPEAPRTERTLLDIRPRVSRDGNEEGLFISSFGEDEAGELYVLDHRGVAYRLAPGT